MPILATALIVALLDGAYPIILNWYRLGLNTPRRVFQSVASGWLGKASFDGGNTSMMIGIASHVMIAVIWTSIYALIVRKLAFVQRLLGTKKGTALVAASYGAFIWLWMNYVVIALSRATVTPATKWQFWSQLVWHMVGVGPAIIYLTEKGRARVAPDVTDARRYGTPASSLT